MIGDSEREFMMLEKTDGELYCAKLGVSDAPEYEERDMAKRTLPPSDFDRVAAVGSTLFLG